MGRLAAAVAGVAAWLVAPGAFGQDLPPEPTEAEVRKEYDEVRVDWLARHADQQQYDVGHILLASEADAKAVIARIMAGEKFEALARTLSTDKASGAKGGSLGWSFPVYFVQPFGEGMKQLRPSGVSREPVHSAFGWHVIQVLGVREPVFPPYEVLEDRLRTELREHWQLYDESGIFAREVEQRSIVTRGTRTFFRYRERLVRGAPPESTARPLQAVVDCVQKQRSDVARDGAVDMRAIYPDTGQERQMRLVCDHVARTAVLAKALGLPGDQSVDPALGCDAPAPQVSPEMARDGSFPGATVVVRGQLTAPAGAIGDVFVALPSGTPSIDNAAVRAFQAMQCKPQAPLQAPQWVHRSFVFKAGGVPRSN